MSGAEIVATGLVLGVVFLFALFAVVTLCNERRGKYTPAPLSEAFPDTYSYNVTTTYTPVAEIAHTGTFSTADEVLEFLKHRKDKTAKTGLRAVRVSEICERTGLPLKDVYQAIDTLEQLGEVQRVEARKRETDELPVSVSYRAVVKGEVNA